MSYSRLRGARKQKAKRENEEQVKIAEKDAFQEQGEKVVEQLVSHPWFLIGSVGAIIVIVAIFLFANSKMNSMKAESSLVYTEALKVWDAEVGEDKEFNSINEKMKKVIEKFSSAASELNGKLTGSLSNLYIGKAHYRLNEYGKAIDFFKKVQANSKIDDKLKFGAYEGEAYCYMDRGELEQAINVWKTYLDEIKVDLYKDQALYYIGTTYEKMNNKEKAAEFFKKLKETYPKSALVVKIADKLMDEKNS